MSPEDAYLCWLPLSLEDATEATSSRPESLLEAETRRRFEGTGGGGEDDVEDEAVVI